MGKSTQSIVVIIMLIVLTGCSTWGQTTLTKTPHSTVAQSSEPKDGFYLPELPEDDGRIWLEIDPIQGWNPPWREWMWEEWIGRNYEEWMQAYQDHWIDEFEFPDCPNRCEQSSDLLPDRACVVACLVKHYYERQEKTVYNVEVSTYEEKFGHWVAICEAEDCPAGYTLYVQVTETDRERMLEWGYRNIITSCESVPPEIYIYGCSQ